jgi:hypothetical protein
VVAVAAALIIHGTSSGSEAQPNQQAAANSIDSPTSSLSPAKLPAKRKVNGVDQVYVPERDV